MAEKFLDNLYHDSTQSETTATYDAWAASYDTEITDNGYATPDRLAKALFEHVPDPQMPILDFGCGTGLSGLALTRAGFKVIDGLDPSSEMLNGARVKGIYRNLSFLDVTNNTPIPKGSYPALVAIGVIGPGAAPPETIHILMNALDSGGVLAFSFNDHAIADKTFELALNYWLNSDAACLVFKQHGPHLPGQNIKSNVYIVEKT